MPRCTLQRYLGVAVDAAALELVVRRRRSVDDCRDVRTAIDPRGNVPVMVKAKVSRFACCLD